MVRVRPAWVVRTCHMAPRLPPPDPNESILPTADGVPVPAPTAVFAAGPATPEADRVAELMLDLRPGIFIVLAA
jgi:hypothetical protein